MDGFVKFTLQAVFVFGIAIVWGVLLTMVFALLGGEPCSYSYSNGGAVKECLS